MASGHSTRGIRVLAYIRKTGATRIPLGGGNSAELEAGKGICYAEYRTVQGCISRENGTGGQNERCSSFGRRQDHRARSFAAKISRAFDTGKNCLPHGIRLPHSAACG